MLSTIRGATVASVLYAVDQGWLELEGAHSACLTEEGRRLIAKEATRADTPFVSGSASGSSCFLFKVSNRLSGG
jgi:hypothetical protein